MEVCGTSGEQHVVQYSSGIECMAGVKEAERHGQGDQQGKGEFLNIFKGQVGP